MPVDERGGDRLANHFERRARPDVTVAEAGDVTRMAREMGDAVGVESEEVGLDEHLRRRSRVAVGNRERLEHRRREGAERVRGDPLHRHGRPACGTPTRIIRITPVAFPAISFSFALSAETMNSVQPSSPPSAHA